MVELDELCSTSFLGLQKYPQLLDNSQGSLATLLSYDSTKPLCGPTLVECES